MPNADYVFSIFLVRLRLKLAAAAFGAYRSFATAANTLCLVLADAFFFPLVTRDTVAIDTLADSATSLTVTIAGHLSWSRLLNDAHGHSAIDDKVFTGNKVIFKQAYDQRRHVSWFALSMKGDTVL